jgi:hypothetical protein
LISSHLSEKSSKISLPLNPEILYQIDLPKN